jgi:hypothetical protein
LNALPRSRATKKKLSFAKQIPPRGFQSVSVWQEPPFPLQGAVNTLTFKRSPSQTLVIARQCRSALRVFGREPLEQERMDFCFLKQKLKTSSSSPAAVLPRTCARSARLSGVRNRTPRAGLYIGTIYFDYLLIVAGPCVQRKGR